MAAYLGAKLNPESGFENDVCIHVKPVTLDKVRDGDWVDFLDGPHLFELLPKRPKVKVIAGSLYSYGYIKERIPNELVYIPHHHINTDRLRRTREGVTTAGYLGSASPIAFEIYGKIREALKKIGIEYITRFDFKTREDAIDLYKSMDILVIGAWELGDPSPYKIPTKIINAASFGIPVVAYPLKGYMDVEGYYFHASNMDELISAVERLKDKTFYEQSISKGFDMAENYHIEKIAEMYRKL